MFLIVIYRLYIYIYIYIYIRHSEEKKNNIYREIFQHFAFINYIILYDKAYAKIH